MLKHPFLAAADELTRAALSLVGATIRPAHGTERWAFAHGRPAAGVVVGVRIPSPRHHSVVCRFPGGDAHLCPFEVDILQEAANPGHYPFIEHIKEQGWDWDDLHPAFQAAAFAPVLQYGLEAARVADVAAFCIAA